MPVAGAADGAAPDAQVETGQAADPAQVQADRERLATEAEKAVKVIEGVLAGTKDALAAKKAEAKQLRSDADKGAKG
jgi:hypothetical protein